MTEREDELFEMAVSLLEHMRWSNDAHVRSRQNPENRDLARDAQLLSDGLELVKRCLADAVIDLRLDLNDRVRAVCPFPAYIHTAGSIRVNPNGHKS